MIFTDFIKQVAKNNYIDWDVKTITAGDYSVEFDITPEFFQRFLDVHGARRPIEMTKA